MKNRSKMILGLASLLGVTAGATAVSGFAWFVTTKTAEVSVTNIGVYNNNPSLTMHINNPQGISQIANTGNDFSFAAVKDSTTESETAVGDGTTKDFVLANTPVRTPTAYVDGKLTATTYNSETRTVSFSTAPAASAAIKFVYWDNAALTDISSIDGVNFYDPTWQVANEGKKATIIPTATAGEHYISFEMEFVAPTEGSLEVFLDRPTITPKDEGKPADVAAASVARVGFATAGTTNKLTISNNVAAGYEKGISKAKVEDYEGDGTVNANTDPDGDYVIANVLDNCQNLVVPSTENYSILSAAPAKTAAKNHIATINGANVTVLVTIWLEGTSAVNEDGNYSAPIGGEINVKLPIVAFGA